ncbi:MAG: hypothetical protein ABR584_12015, partial [Candidatus Baltobacteraceae bacterium]
PGPHGVAPAPIGVGVPGMILGPSGFYVPAPSSVARTPRTIAAGRTARAKHPTRVLAAAVGPESIQLVPLSKTPCVWHRTAVLGAAMGPNRRIGRSYGPGSRAHRHSNCR